MGAARTQSRRVVLMTLAAFVGLQAALSWLVFSDGVTFREPLWRHKLTSHRRRVAAHPGAMQVVQIGSSRTMNALCGTEIEPELSQTLGQPVLLLNLGSAGSAPVGTQFNLMRLLDDGVRPDLLLVEVLPALLHEEAKWPELTPAKYPAAHLRWQEAMWIAAQIPDERPWLPAEWVSEQLTPASAHRQGLIARFRSLTRMPALNLEASQLSDEAGWERQAPLPPHEAARSLARSEEFYSACLQAFHLSSRKVEAARATIALAQSKGIPTAVVLMPEGPTFRNWYPPGRWEQLHAVIADLAAQQGVPLLDLRECLDEGDFIDSHHMLEQGARKYTRVLATRIEPLLRQIHTGR